MNYIRDLLAEARRGDPVAVDELADFVEHVLEQPSRRVETAFGLTRRGQSTEAAQRIQERDAGLLDYAELLGGDLSLEKRAATMVARLRRYSPAEDEVSPERLAMRRVVSVGVGIPGARQVRRIISAALRK
jgi:hypothetical protein